MTQVIIYPNEHREGSITVLYPVPFEQCRLTLEQIALKDVPAGKPFRYVLATDIPEDHTLFDAFEADFSSPDGYGADYGVGSNKHVIAWNEDGSPVLSEGN